MILDMGGRDETLSEELLKNVDIISPNEVLIILPHYCLDWIWKSCEKESGRSRANKEGDLRTLQSLS